MAREARRGRNTVTINKGRITLREELAAAKAAIRFAIWDNAYDAATGETLEKLESRALSKRIYKGTEKSGDLMLTLYEEAFDAVFGKKQRKAA
jgi:hypothetical protein